MRKKQLKKAIALVLSVAMMVGTINFMPGGVLEVKAVSPIVKDINLGTIGIRNPTAGGNADNWEGSKVYFGSDTMNTWRILDVDTSNALLFADRKLGSDRRFDDDSNVWDNSELRTWLNGNEYKTDTSKFSIVEQSKMIGEMTLLTVDEVQNTAYGFVSGIAQSNTRHGWDNWWWLRSPGTTVGYTAFIFFDGEVKLGGYPCNDNLLSVRPVFDLDMSSVLFTSASGTSKSSFAEVGNANISANTWKLTFKDDDIHFETDALPGTGYAGQSITVNVTVDGDGTYNQTSAILRDSDGIVAAYGKIGEAGTGNKTFTIPSTVALGNYFLYVFEEQVNTGNVTDYASRQSIGSITISEAPATYDVSITSGSNMTRIPTSGAASQTNLTGAITDIVYTADNGYYFPTDYNSDNALNVDGLIVTRNSYTQITVSGTPTVNASITLTAATEKEEQFAPTGLSDGVDKIAGTTTAMEYASSATATTWNACTASNTTVAAGTWYVRYKETDTKKAGATAEITVTASTIFYDVTITSGSNMTRISTSGAASQTNLTGAITDVVYTADNGYYFPTDYNSDNALNVDGLIVARDSYTQITVSGTPTANVNITLTAATEKESQSAPTGLSDGVDKIIGTTTAMEYASSATATTWNACTNSNTTVAAGTWYVRNKETATKKAGSTAGVTVTASQNPPTLYQVTVNNGSGDGTYAENATVTITADTATSGKQFKNWTVVSGSITLASTKSETTTFVMPAGAVEVSANYENLTTSPTPTPKPKPKPKPKPTITAGAGGTHQKGSNGTMTITCSGALEDLTGIYVDGELVDSSNYTLKSGSTILTFKKSYLDTLSVGTHTLKFAYSDKSAETTFKIKASGTIITTDSTASTDTKASTRDDAPKTGDHTPVVWLLLLFMASGTGVFYFQKKKTFVEDRG